jgi:hypothetical protein
MNTIDKTLDQTTDRSYQLKIKRTRKEIEQNWTTEYLDSGKG